MSERGDRKKPKGLPKKKKCQNWDYKLQEFTRPTSSHCTELLSEEFTAVEQVKVWKHSQVNSSLFLSLLEEVKATELEFHSNIPILMDKFQSNVIGNGSWKTLIKGV